MIRTRNALVALAAMALLPLAASCGSSEQGTSVRVPSKAETSKVPNKANCSDPDLSQADWTAQCAHDAPADDQPNDQPDTELAVGDGFRYNDGVRVSVTKIAELGTSVFGEYDEKPDTKHTGFRVTYSVTNGTRKPLDLDSWGIDAQGATTGGDTEYISAENGAKAMSGRLASGRTATFTGEYSLAKSDGRSVVVTMTRMDGGAEILAEDPHWTGSIK
jgi:hypothetical protein